MRPGARVTTGAKSGTLFSCPTTHPLNRCRSPPSSRPSSSRRCGTTSPTRTSSGPGSCSASTPPAGHASCTRSPPPDAIRNWALGVGDDNPLYIDEEYGPTTRWGTQIGHGTMVGHVKTPMLGDPIPAEIKQQTKSLFRGVHVFVSGGTWDWYRPLRPGDRIYSFSGDESLEVKKSEFAGRSAVRVRRDVALNQFGEVRRRVPDPGRAHRAQGGAHRGQVRRDRARALHRRRLRAHRRDLRVGAAAAARSRATGRTSRSATRCRPW